MQSRDDRIRKKLRIEAGSSSSWMLPAFHVLPERTGEAYGTKKTTQVRGTQRVAVILGKLPLRNQSGPTHFVAALIATEAAAATSIVILQPQMRNQLFALQMPQGVLQLHQLNE